MVMAGPANTTSGGPGGRWLLRWQTPPKSLGRADATDVKLNVTALGRWCVFLLKMCIHVENAYYVDRICILTKWRAKRSLRKYSGSFMSSYSLTVFLSSCYFTLIGRFETANYYMLIYWCGELEWRNWTDSSHFIHVTFTKRTPYVRHCVRR